MEEDWDNEDWDSKAPVQASAPHQSRDNNRGGNNRSDWNDDRNDDRRSGSKYNDRPRSSYNRSNNHSDDRQSKRSNEFDDRRSGYGRNRGDDNDDDCSMIDINFNMAGKVIGSGGSQVRDIQERFNVRVNVGMYNILSYLARPLNFTLNVYRIIRIEKDARNNSAQVKIRGESRNVSDAKRFVQDLLADNNSSGPNRHQNESRPQNGNYSETHTLEIDPGKVGMVIGRGGSTIRDLQGKFSVNVNVGMYRK